MASKGRKKVKLVSTAGTGTYYTTTKNTKDQDKLAKKKYDPKTKKHELFKEEKI
jgi:large subunit ribosomal protein L33